MSKQGFIPTPTFDEYADAFRNHYRLTRREDGVLLAEAHTEGGPVQLSVENHRSVGQLFRAVAADPTNEVFIFSGSGDQFMVSFDPEGFAIEQEDLEHWAYEYAYKDGRINVGALINEIEIPTIGIMNGPGFHAELCLMCDLTLCSEDAVIFDPHFSFGSVPGDGIHCALQELLGVKRAAYALLTGEIIDAQKALDYGLVNEVLPRDRLIDRAFELADQVMLQARTTRRMTTQIVRRPWKKRVLEDLDGGFGIQMFSHLAKREAIHVDAESGGGGNVLERLKARQAQFIQHAP